MLQIVRDRAAAAAVALPGREPQAMHMPDAAEQVRLS